MALAVPPGSSLAVESRPKKAATWHDGNMLFLQQALAEAQIVDGVA